MAKSKQPQYEISVAVNLWITTTVEASSMEDALTKARNMKVFNVVRVHEGVANDAYIGVVSVTDLDILAGACP